MLKLRKVLLSNYLYFAIVFLVLICTIIRITIPKQSKYSRKTTEIIGVIQNIKITDKKIEFLIKGKEKIIANYYYKNKKEIDSLNKLLLGQKVWLKGNVKEINKNTLWNTFSYKDYLNRQGINYIFTIKEIEVVDYNMSLLYVVKNSILDRINSISKSKHYLYAFILGDSSKINKNILNSYRDLGISHLFALSGMHVSVLTGIIIYFLKQANLKELSIYLFSFLFLLLFISIIGFKPSIFRAVLFFICFSINRIYYFYIKPYNIFLLVFSVTLLISPNSLFDIGFLYSFFISLGLLVFVDRIRKFDGFIKKTLYTSLIAFIISLPITLYNFCQINFLSIFFNIFYIPFISIIIFPLALVTFVFPFLDKILFIFINILESITTLFNQINLFKIVFYKGNVFFNCIYIVIIILVLYKMYKGKYYFLILIVLLLFINFIYPNVIPNKFVTTIDVGQGDSILIYLNHKVVLLDTGGNENSNYNLSSNIHIPYFKSLGLSKLDYLVITHGDFDHMGEAINLVNNFKVEKVIFNCGPYNDLEKELINVLDKKKIKYYYCIKELNIDNNKLYFLQTKEYDNENDNSNVIITELGGYKFMFMGDASSTTEKEIMNKYNLLNLDVLKVGHHGSKTSSGKEFINEINPKYSIISVGKNNRYGHPNKEVLNNLEESKIYRTDKDGSIMFKIKNSKLKIETCSP